MPDNAEKPSAVLIGYKGVKYGLQKGKAVSAPKPAAFGDDSSSEDEVEVQLKKQQQQNLKASKIAAARAAAVAEDSTVYEYDAVYDDIQRSREAPKRKEVEERKPKYIQALVQKAEIRKKEQDIAYERRLLKERKKDDHLYDEKEAFLTTAYKKKLEDDRYWIERERRMDAIEEAEDVTKRSDLTGFYQNLVTKNVAFASNRLAEAEAKAPSEPLVESADAEPAAHSSESIPAAVAEESVKMPPSPERRKQTTPSTEDTPVSDGRASPHDPMAGRRKRRNDDASIASARERYLARKRRTQTGTNSADASVG